MARGTPTVALIALIALVAATAAACAGEIHDVRGDLKRPYAALVIADAVVASSAEVAGEEGVTLTLVAAEAVETVDAADTADAPDSRADDVARRSTVDAVTYDVRLDVLAPTEERLLGGCLERLQEW